MPRAARLILALLALLLTTVTLGRPATALTDGAQIDVVIDDINPLIPRPGGILVVSGRVANISASQLDDVSVRLRTSIDPIASRPMIDDIASAPLSPNAPYDNRFFDRTRIPIEGGLAPGEQASFTIRIPMRELRLTKPGTYTLSVEALGRDAVADEFEDRKGIQRTFLPWFPNPKDVTPIGLTWLWPLADQPARDADGSFITDGTPNALAPGGRLRELVDIGAASPAPVTWVADPELLQAAAAISRGYQVLRDGTPIVGDQSKDAATWLQTLSRAVRNTTVHLLPYADVDAGAMNRAGLSDDVIRSITSATPVAKQVIESPVEGNLAWAPSGRFDKQTANLLATAGVRTVVLDASALPPTQTTDTPSGIADYGTSAGPIDAVLIDQGIAQTLGLPQQTDAEVLAARQRFLAHTALIAAQAEAPQGRVIVAAPPDLRWHPDPRLITSLLRATATAPWLHPATLNELTAADRVPRKRMSYGTEAKNAELSPRYVARVVKSQERLDRLISVLVDPIRIAPPYGAALLRTESSAWRADQKTGERLITTVNTEIADRVDVIRPLSSGTVTFSGDTGRVPVTIANDGADAVMVGVALVGNPASRLASTPHEPIEVAPGRKVSIDLDARVIGGDPLTVQVQLLTPEGAPFGDPETITLGSTAYARAAAWVVGLAFVAITIFVVVGITRRIMKVRREASTTAAGSSDTVSS